MYVNQNPDLIQLAGKAQDVISVAAARGYAIPTDYSSANQIAAAATKIATGPAFTPGTAPTDPRKVPAWVSSVAQGRLEDREARTVAADLADQMTRTAMSSALAAVPAYVDTVIGEFTAHLTAFTGLLTEAPRQVSSAMTPAEFEKHAQLLRATEALTSAAVDRGRLGLAVGEAEHIGPDPLWLVLDPHPSTYLGAVTETLTTFRGRLPITLEEWEQVVRLGVKMAGPGDVLDRKERHNRAGYASGMSPDGGLRDKRYAEALGQVAA